MSKLHVVASKQQLNSDMSLSKSSTPGISFYAGFFFLFFALTRCLSGFPTSLVELRTCAEFWILGARDISVTKCIYIYNYNYKIALLVC